MLEFDQALQKLWCVMQFTMSGQSILSPAFLPGQHLVNSLLSFLLPSLPHTASLAPSALNTVHSTHRPLIISCSLLLCLSSTICRCLLTCSLYSPLLASCCRKSF